MHAHTKFHTHLFSQTHTDTHIICMQSMSSMLLLRQIGQKGKGVIVFAECQIANKISVNCVPYKCTSLLCFSLVSALICWVLACFHSTTQYNQMDPIVRLTLVHCRIIWSRISDDSFTLFSWRPMSYMTWFFKMKTLSSWAPDTRVGKYRSTNTLLQYY